MIQEFFFLGFDPVISPYLLGITIVLSFLFAWWTYSYLKTISGPKRLSIITLRAASLTILIILLFNPFFRTDTSETEKPIINVYLDNSQSITMERGEYAGLNTYSDFLDNFSFNDTSEVSYSFFHFSDDVMRTTLQLPDGTGSLTNLEAVLRHMQESTSAASILFSDGIQTRGRDPVFTARTVSHPVYTVPLGDTTAIRDVAISEVIANATGYTNTIISVEAVIMHQGYGETSTRVELREENNTMEDKQVSFSGNESSHNIDFTLQFSDPGIYQLEVITPVLDGEHTEINNRYPFTIEILDEKTRILHLAFEIHPDVGAIRSLLATDDSIELQTYTWAGQSRFIEGNPLQNEENFDLVILHGLPAGNIEMNNWLTELTDSYPVILFQLPQTPLHSNLFPVQFSNSGAWLDITPQYSIEQDLHPILELPLVNFSRYPTLKILYGNYVANDFNQILFNAVYAGLSTDLPIMLVNETGNRRNALVTASGWFRPIQSSVTEIKAFTEQLLINLVSWTSVDPDRRNLRLAPVKRIFDETEDVTIRAILTNESGEPETDAVIQLNLRSQDYSERSYTLQNRGRGNYEVNLGRLPEGNYSYNATARKGAREIEQTDGSFSVTATTIEFINTKRDDAFLNQVSELTNGLFIESGRNELILTHLRENDRLRSIERKSSSFHYLHQYSIWFLLLLALLSAEWILRRSVSLP
jgi:hypothetical protein